MATYKTPGVYVEEISTLPPSIAEVETAIPAFFGFTEKGAQNTPLRISCMMEYQLHFGGPEPEKGITVNLVGDLILPSIDPAKRSKNVLFYAMHMYFANGGGPCYIVSVGLYPDSGKASLDLYTAALQVVAKEDEPTLLVFPDAVYLLQPAQYYSLMNNALIQCEELGDRFAIMDVVNINNDLTASKTAFRDAISSNLEQAKYGAAYFPYLSTTMSYAYDEDCITVIGLEAQDAPVAAPVAQEGGAPEGGQRPRRQAAAPAAGTKFSGLTSALKNQIRQRLRDLAVEISPCGAVAGIYANTDKVRGVWKAPANVSLNYVKAPLMKITDDDQKDLNVDVTAGKSINAIRAFTGKGTKVWGARTLAGNDNEWRYVSVRRFFNMVEESVKKSSSWVVFEPNDANTWVKVRAMIENYLTLKWKEGALAGSKKEEAYYVHVGLGMTMSANDIEEGRMIIEIGLAVVRPAEFIILRFSHKVQTS